MADTSTERERQRRELHEALNDDPGGLNHPIWAELGIAPIAPISPEELWLIDQSMRIADDAEAAAFVRTKVWGRNPKGNLVKLWTLENLAEAPTCVQEFIAQHPYSVDGIARCGKCGCRNGEHLIDCPNGTGDWQ